MRKIVIHRPGGYNRLKIETHPDPRPEKGEVLVAIKAAGINFADIVIRMGLYESAKQFVGWPITPGFEFAGEVLETGDDVKDLKRGTKVFGITLFGAYSTHICVPRHQVFPLPKGFTLEQSATFPTVFMTAYHALFQNIKIKPGMTALIHSAAGGVGSALLQLSKIAGFKKITGVVGADHKIKTAESFGADFVINKSRENLWHRAREICPEGYDIILDGNGPSTLRQSFKHLTATGKLVTYGFHSMFSKKGGFPNYFKLAYEFIKIPRFNPLDLVNQNKSVLAFNLSFLFSRTDLLEDGMHDLLEWSEIGKIRPLPLQTFDFEDVAKSHKALESGKTIGKLALLM